MPDKILELEATMRDRVSDTIRTIKRNVDDLNRSTTDLGTQRKAMAALGQEMVNLGRAGGGIQQTTKHLRDFHQQFREVSAGLRETGKAVKEQLMPAFEGLGFGVTTVGGAFTVLLATMKNVTEESRNLQNIAKLSGFDADSVRGMASAATAYGVSGDKMIATMKKVAFEMDKIAGTPGGGGSELLNRLRQHPELQALTRDLERIANDRNIPEAQRKIQGVKRLFAELDEIRKRTSPAHAANVAETVFGWDRETALLADQAIDRTERYTDALRRMGEEVSPEQLTRQAVANQKLSASIEGIKNAIAFGLVDNVSAATTALADFIDANNKPISDEVVKFMKEVAGAAEDIGSKLHYLKDLEDILNKLNNLHPGTIVRNALPDWAKPNFDVPVLPGVNPLRAAAGAPPLRDFGGGFGGGSTVSPPPPAQPGFWQTGIGQWGDLLHGRPVRPFQATKPQMFTEEGTLPTFGPGSLGTGSITGGWRHSSNVEDLRSNEDRVSDEESRKGTYDNTAAERENTDQLRKLIEVMSRGNLNAGMDFSGGLGAGGQGGGFGAGQGPMFRGPSGGHPSGVGPGSRARPGGVHNVPVSPPPSVHPAVIPKHTPGATVTPGPTAVTPTPPPLSSIPSPSTFGPAVPMQNGGVIRDPATIVDQATGRPVATMAENKPELVVPVPESPSDWDRLAEAIGRQEGYGRSGAIPTQLNNPGDIKYGSFAAAHGSTGPGRGGHAIFPDYATGKQALIDLLQSKGGGQSISQIGTWWAEDPNWAAGVSRYSGFPPSYVPHGAATATAATTAGPPATTAGPPAGWKQFGLIGQGGSGDLAMTEEAKGPGLGRSDTSAVDPTLVGMINETAKHLPEGWSARILSGKRDTPAWSFHTRGLASDVQLYSKDWVTDKIEHHDIGGVDVPSGGPEGLVPWYQTASTYRIYQAFAEKMHDVQQKQYPQASNLAWGGYFSGDIGPQGLGPGATQTAGSGHYGVMDLMHFSLGEGQIAGHLGTGLSPEWQKRWGVPDPKPPTQGIFDTAPHKAWHPTGYPQISTGGAGPLPGGGSRPIDLSQPGLTGIPGVGGQLGAGAPKTEPAPPAHPDASPPPTPATGAGQQPKSIRLGHGRPAAKWAPGQGGQTNVPGDEQFARLAGIPPALKQQLDIARLGQRAARAAGQGAVSPITQLAHYGDSLTRGEPFHVYDAIQAAAPFVASMATGALGGAAFAGRAGLGAAMTEALGGEFGNVGSAVAAAAGKHGLATIGSAAIGDPAATILGRLATAAPLYSGLPETGRAPGGLGGNAAIEHKVTGTGTIDINIKAPRGANVNASSAGLFKKVNLRRGQSMEAADEHGQYSE